MAIGRRVELAEFLRSDLDAVHAYTSNPEVCRYSTWGTNTLAETGEFLADAMERQPGRIMAAVMVAGKVIGSAAIWRTGETQRAGAMGYTLNQEYWGQGFATEVANLLLKLGFEKLGLTRVEATCDPGNAASIRVLEKSGFRFVQRRVATEPAVGGRKESLVYALNAPVSGEGAMDQ